MAAEVDIREAIAAQVQAAVGSSVVVLSRDILDVTTTGWLTVLRNEATQRIRGWTVTQSGAEGIEQRNRGAEYRLWFDVWQWFQYETGTDAVNSENQSSAERDAVIRVFSRVDAELPSILSNAGLLEFPPGSIGTAEVDIRGQVRVAKGLLRVETVIGCNG